MDWLTLNGAVRLAGALMVTIVGGVMARRLNTPLEWVGLVALMVLGGLLFFAGWARLLP